MYRNTLKHPFGRPLTESVQNLWVATFPGLLPDLSHNHGGQKDKIWEEA